MEPPFRAYSGPEPYVFVCYAHEDAALVYPQIVRLRDAGFHIWYDEGIAPGYEWSEALAEHIEGCAVFLYFVTPRSVEREHCRREVNFALEQQCSMLAVHLCETEVPAALKLSLSNRQAILGYELSSARFQEKLDETLARAAVGRSDHPAENPARFHIGDWVVDAGSGTLANSETSKHLPPQTMAVLAYLARHPGEIVSNEELLERVWQGRFTADDSVYQHIGRIRSALGDHSKAPEYIETIPRRGYRLIAQVEEPRLAGAGPAASDGRPAARAPTVATMALAVAGLVVLLIIAVWWLQPWRSPANQAVVTAKTTGAPTIAVLPFTNMSTDPDQVYFADGIAEDILNLLARNTSLSIRPRASSFAVKDQSLSLEAIGEQLAVTHVLEGSVRRSGERIRVTVHLSDVQRNQSIWSNQYDRQLTDVFAVQDEITTDVVRSLGAQFERRAPPRNFVSTEAYDAFLLGRHYRNRGEMETAAKYLNLATAEDATNADAWAIAADVQSYRLFSGYMPTTDRTLTELFRYTDNAVAIHPTHASGLSTQALWRFIVDREFQTSIESLVDLAEVNPNDPDVHVHLAFCLRGIRRYDLAELAGKRAREIDRASYIPVATLLDAYNLAGALDKARALANEVSSGGLSLGHSFYHYMFHVAVASGDRGAMRANLIARSRFPTSRINVAMDAYVRADTEALNNAVQEITDSSPFMTRVDQSYLALLQGRVEEAIEHWRAGIEAHEGAAVMYAAGYLSWRTVFPEFYMHPDYQRMLVDFGLDPDSLARIRVPALPF